MCFWYSVDMVLIYICANFSAEVTPNSGKKYGNPPKTSLIQV